MPEGIFSAPEKKNLPRTAQLALHASREALKDAGIDDENLSEEESNTLGSGSKSSALILKNGKSL